MNQVAVLHSKTSASPERHSKQFSDSRNGDGSNPIGRIGSYVHHSAAAIDDANFIPINALKVIRAGPLAILMRRAFSGEVADVLACKCDIGE